jgi:multiple sugar transport system ATP-binding protein
MGARPAGRRGAMASVAFEHVDKRYPGGVEALCDLCLELADGELLALVGPSGCGKSTVLRLLAGLEAPTAGTIRLGGRAVNELPPKARNVAMVFQDYALYPTRTVRGNLAFPLEMRRLPRDEVTRRVEATAELLEIRDLLERLPRELSGGQRQRVAMGRALVREPAAFLLDEPLSNLDAKLRVQVRAEIAELRRRTGTTMLYVTHDQVEAMTLGDRVAVLQRGRLQQVAPPRELYERPGNAFVAGFIGSPPMNLLPARLAEGAAGSAGAPGGLSVELAGVRLPLPPALADAARRAAASDAGALLLGIRPEDLALAAGAAPGTLAVDVAHVEYLGHETLAHLTLGPLRLVARLATPQPLTPGTRLHLSLPPTALHVFTKESPS